MYSLNPVQEKRNQIINNLVKSFDQPNIIVVETPDNPIPQLRQFVSNNIEKSISGNEDLEKAEGSRGGVVIGHTESGKPIYKNSNESNTSSYSSTDHSNAMATHQTEMKKYPKMNESGVKNKDYANHAKMMDFHRRQAARKEVDERSDNNDLQKGMGAGKGEGSRGGKVIGHTSTGKPIYGDLSAKEHKGFTPQDHRDAADLYHSQYLMGGLQHRLSKHKRNDHHILAEAGGNSLKDRKGSSKKNQKTTSEEVSDFIHGKDKSTKSKKSDEDSSAKYLSDAKKKAKSMGAKELINKRDYHEAAMKDYDDKNNADYKYHEAHVAMYKEAIDKVSDKSKVSKKEIKKSNDLDDLHKSFDYEQDDRDIIRKGEVLEKLGMGYGGNNPLTFTKTGKELKAILPVTIANLNAKKDALEALMEGYKETAEVDPTEICQSYSIKSIACKKYKYELIDTYDRSSGQYATPTDQQVAMRQYNDCCYVWQSICEDITAANVILANVDDNKKYTLSVSQLIAISTGL